MTITEALSLLFSLVGGTAQPRCRPGRQHGTRPRHEPVRPARLRHPRHHSARLRGLRLRPRRHRWGADPAYRPGHGRHSGHLRRGPDRHATVDTPEPAPGQPHDHHDHRATHPQVLSAPTHHHTSSPTRLLPACRASPRPGSSPAAPPTRKGIPSAQSSHRLARQAAEQRRDIEDLAKCLTNQGIRLGVTYQPASRYWPLQGAETGIFLVLSLALIGYCFRRISRLP